MRPLTVAGAFHTHVHGAGRARTLGAVAAGVPVRDPRADPAVQRRRHRGRTGADLLARLVRQVTRPVRWDLCQAHLRDLGVTAIIELPPAGTLAGIAKRELPGVETRPVNTPDDLAAARALIARRPRARPGRAHRRLPGRDRPGRGHVRRGRGDRRGRSGRARRRLGTVRTNREELAVSATTTGVLVEWLRDDGDLVAAASRWPGSATERRRTAHERP